VSLRRSQSPYRRSSVGKMHVKLVGDSPLICHAWSHKAKQEMLDKQLKKAKQKREAKDPTQDVQNSLYPLTDGSGYGFPGAFKAAAVDACRNVEGVTMALARGAFHIDGELVPLKGNGSLMRRWFGSAWARPTFDTGQSSGLGAPRSWSVTTRQF
jgi:hypothetical protein